MKRTSRTTKPKLSLHAETLRNLSPDELRQNVGATGPGTKQSECFCTLTCPEVCSTICPSAPILCNPVLVNHNPSIVINPGVATVRFGGH